ncbi:1927_t:CDS:2 [Paraglomus occultum]|uniref:1927_t:CDS:1 n=1 Tax=Paraglomus occultum TaxID=144539 RepID=A0A9N9APD3_9GLOM|nr:1927_t:CDS:2 [Paraglomus occultum]
MNDGQLANPDEMLASGIFNDASFKDEEDAFAETDNIKKPDQDCGYDVLLMILLFTEVIKKQPNKDLPWTRLVD